MKQPKEYKNVPRSVDVIPRGIGERLPREIRRAAKGGAKNKRGYSKIRVVKPPEGGWRGGDPKDNGSKK